MKIHVTASQFVWVIMYVKQIDRANYWCIETIVGMNYSFLLVIADSLTRHLTGHRWMLGD